MASRQSGNKTTVMVINHIMTPIRPTDSSLQSYRILGSCPTVGRYWYLTPLYHSPIILINSILLVGGWRGIGIAIKQTNWYLDSPTSLCLRLEGNAAQTSWSRRQQTLKIVSEVRAWSAYRYVTWGKPSAIRKERAPYSNEWSATLWAAALTDRRRRHT